MKRSCLSKLKTNNVANKYVPKVLNEKAKTSNFYFTPSEKLCLWFTFNYTINTHKKKKFIINYVFG